MNVYEGMSLRDALAVAREIGCTVSHPRRTGEVRIEKDGKRLNVNNRKKDAPRVLVWMLRDLMEN